MNQLLQYYLYQKNQLFTASTLADFSCKIGKKQIWAWPHTLWVGQGVQNIAGAQPTPHRPCGGPIGGLIDPEPLIFCCGQSAIFGLKNGKKNWLWLAQGPVDGGGGLLGVPSSNLVCHMPWGAPKSEGVEVVQSPKTVLFISYFWVAGNAGNAGNDFLGYSIYRELYIYI